MKFLTGTLLIAGTMALAVACGNGKSAATPAPQSKVATPAASFAADSAYEFVARQVAFGPRTPGSAAHKACADWLIAKLEGYGATVLAPDTVVIDAAGRRMPVRNIFASLNPAASRRVLLAAHYDTRPYADNDPDHANHAIPIDGANDGASGVAVILEIARNAAALPTWLGLDILLTDAEDSGEHEGFEASWCVGAQQWAADRRPTDAPISYGILLDMVGGRNARFHREYFSERYAKEVSNRIWKAASELGYDDRFPEALGGAINDDHVYLMGAGFPVADIIECRNPETGSFNPTWHTVNDNLDNIDPMTMKMVGDVVIKAISK